MSRSQSGNMLGTCLCVWCFVYFLSFMELANSKEVYGNPSPDFSKQSVVKPKLQHGRTKREIISTKDSTGLHHSEVTLTVSIDGEDHELELRLNEALLPHGHSLSYQQGGRTKVHTPAKEELDLCQYSGRVRGRPDSWAAVSTCRGVRGVIYDGDRLRYIEPADGDINGAHFLYSHEHLTSEHRCGNTDGMTNHSSYDHLQSKESQNPSIGVNRHKRDSEPVKVRPPGNANQRSRYVELVLVVDHSQFVANGRDLGAVHHHMKDLANIINSVYAPLNIFIALTGVEVWTDYDQIAVDENAGITLDRFNKYRSTRLINTIPNDNAHLFTKKFKGTSVGIAYVGTMCSTEQSAGVATNHSGVIGTIAMTMAHEMGHNFGMNHDDFEGKCKCPDEKCIMSPQSSRVIPVHWSSCSLQSLGLSFEKSLDYCLRNEPKKLFESPTCGNGFLEEGEQCDCGTAPGEPRPGAAAGACRRCCRPDCTLRANATCANGQCCDITTCNPKATGTECRTANHECDLPEFCDGATPFCPQNVYKMDATPCGNGEAYCVRGSCRSHTNQCQLLWGITGKKADDLCYDKNVHGNEFGNCGHDSASGTYFRCASQDAACGRLQCFHLVRELEYSNFKTAILRTDYAWTKTKNIPCHSAVTDTVHMATDAGLVPDGAKCGPDKMCMQQKCLPVEQVRKMVTPKGSVCPSNCSGHGVCNSNGNCHCEVGFSPPLCDEPGAGGSRDSGPATDTTDLSRFKVAMYIIFLGIVPAIALIFLAVYCCRCHGLLCWKNRNNFYEKPYQPRFGSKFALPNLNTFGKWLNRDTNKDTNKRKGPVAVVSTNKNNNVENENVENHGYAELCNGRNVTTAMAPESTININNKAHSKEPVRYKILKKEEIFTVENYSHAPIHNPSYNLDVPFKPKVDAMKNKFESISSEQKPNSSPPSYRNLNRELAVVKNNQIGSPIHRLKHSPPAPVLKPNLCPEPSVGTKHTILQPGVDGSLKASVCIKPSVSPKPNRVIRAPCGNSLKAKLTKINTDLSSTNNEFLNQRSKLRKVGNRDLNQ